MQDIQQAQAKWARNAVAGAKNWHGDPMRFCEALSRFGLNMATCQSGVGQRYAAGVSAVGPAQFQAAVQAAAQTDRWARRWLEGLSR